MPFKKIKCLIIKAIYVIALLVYNFKSLSVGIERFKFPLTLFNI